MSGDLDWHRDGPGWPHHDWSRFVEVGRMRWHVQAGGRGPDLLLLHGAAASTHSWRDLMPMLAERFRVVAIDLPGHGFTHGHLRRGSTLPGMAAGLAELLSITGVRPALVAGHSAGAAVAARLALDGATAAPIIAFCPALLPFPGMAGPVFSTIAGTLLVNPFTARIVAGIAGSGDTVARFLARSTGSRLSPEGAALYRRLFSAPGHVSSAIAMMADWDLHALERDLPRLGVRLHVAHGEHDAAIPVPSAREAAGRVRRGSFELLPALGHLAHEEDPAGAAAIIARVGAEEGAWNI